MPCCWKPRSRGDLSPSVEGSSVRASTRRGSQPGKQSTDDSREREARASACDDHYPAVPGASGDSGLSRRDFFNPVGDCPPTGQRGPVTSVTSRELETLLQLACFHYLTADQAEGFLFDGSTLLPSSRAAVTRRVLAGLVRSGFVTTAARTLAAGGVGPARRVYVLTPSGEAFLRRSGSRAGPPPARRGSLFIEHALMTAEVALAFKRAARAEPGLRVISWESDWDLAAAIPGSPLVPDARVVLATDDLTLDIFLEVDRATERPAAFARKIERYLEWHWNGTWREQLSIWPLVLVVTQSAVRAVSLRRTTETVLARWGGEGTEFRFAALAHLAEHGPMAEIWQVAGRAGQHVLIDAEPEASVAEPATA